MLRETQFSPDRRYRYSLWREWNAAQVEFATLVNSHVPQMESKGFVNFVCLNPSTADETKNDPTIEKCITYSKRWGYAGFCMTNIFAWRATDPEEMKRNMNPIGINNDAYILEIAQASSLVVCGWGNHGSHLERGPEIKQMLLKAGVKLHALKVNQDGSPNHPLYLKKTLVPKLYT